MDKTSGYESTSIEGSITMNKEEFRVDDILGKGIQRKYAFADDLAAKADEDGFFEDDDEEGYRQEQVPLMDLFDLNRQKELSSDLLEERPVLEDIDTEAYEDITPDGYVQKKILKAGTGKKVPSDARVFVHYVGFCNDSMEPFDTTLRKRVCAINLEPPGEIIPGLWLALKSMEVSEIAQFIIHFSYGFLETGCPPRIPANAVLIYNVKMLSFAQFGKMPISNLSYEQRRNMAFQEILDEAKNLRTDGNGKYKEGRFVAAIRSYRRAVDLLEEYSTSTEEDNDSRSEFLTSLYHNIGKSHLKLFSPEPCCVACKRGLNLEAKTGNGKLLQLFAQAKSMLHSYGAALNLVKRARSFEDSGACDDLEKEIRAKMEREKMNEAFMAKRMLGLSTKK